MSEQIRENVDKIVIEGKEIYLVGTAHISQASADLTEEVIREVQPHSVAVELCEQRYQSLKNPDRWKNTDILSVLRQGKAYVLMAQLMLASFQKRLGDKLKVKPGAEMMRAVTVAEAVGATTVLADRDITVTLKRTWASLGFWSMLKLTWAMVNGVFSEQSIDENEIERLKSSDALNEMMKEFSEALPEVRKSLIDERDEYLAAKIKSAPGTKVVAILGAGHIPGVKAWLAKNPSTVEISSLPQPRMWVKLLGWLIPVTIVGLIIYGFIFSGADASMHMVITWILITGGFAAAGTALAFGHPLSILSAFIASPLTTIHPFLASGWIAGLVEAWIRKPRVSDLETIADDLGSMSGIWKNRVSRILLVVALTNLTGTLGALWGIKMVASMI